MSRKPKVNALAIRAFRPDGLRAAGCPVCGKPWSGHPACPKCGTHPVLHSQLGGDDLVCRNCSWASYDGGCEGCFRLKGHEDGCPNDPFAKKAGVKS